MRRGRNACIIVKGATMLLFRTSDHSGDDILLIAPVGYDGGGGRMKAAKCSLCAAEFGMGWCGAFRKFANF